MKISPYVVPGLKGVLLTSLGDDKKLEALRAILEEYSLQKQPKVYRWKDIQGKSRKRELVLLRHMYCFICYKHKIFSTLKSIGDSIGNRDHTTVRSANNSIQDLLDSNDIPTVDLYHYINNNL